MISFVKDFSKVRANDMPELDVELSGQSVRARGLIS